MKKPQGPAPPVSRSAIDSQRRELADLLGKLLARRWLAARFGPKRPRADGTSATSTASSAGPDLRSPECIDS